MLTRWNLLLVLPTKPSSSSSPDDALLRMCGAEVACSLKSLQKKRSTKLKANQHESVDTLNKHLALLKSMCVPNAEKSKHDDIPQGIKKLDSGYMWVPCPCLLPFLRKFDWMFWQQMRETIKHMELPYSRYVHLYT